MLIGDLAKRTGLTRDTIRFYEKEKLIAPVKPDRRALRTNDYKDYPEAAVSTLEFVRRTKALGFTLNEIRMLMALRERKEPGSRKWVSEAEAKVLEIDRKLKELRILRVVITQALVRCSDRCLDEGCEVLDGKTPGACA